MKKKREPFVAGFVVRMWIEVDVDGGSFEDALKNAKELQKSDARELVASARSVVDSGIRLMQLVDMAVDPEC